MKVASNGEDTIHFAFTDGHPRNEPQNSIYYVRYRAGAFWRADGTRIGDLTALPLEPRATDVVHDGRVTKVRAWIWDVAADAAGRPVVVYAYLPAEDRHVYRYARWDGKAWRSHEISVAGKWFPKTPEGKREPEPHYSGGVVLDHDDPSVVYLSRPVDGVFEIERWTTRDGGATWSSAPVTRGSKVDNVRPFVVRDRASGKGPDVLWMCNTGPYVHYTNYRSAIKMNVPSR